MHLEMNATIRDAVHDGIARALAAVGLSGIALIHLLDIPGKFSETPYMAWMYVGLIVASVGLAGALIRRSDGWVWTGAAALAASVIAGYTLSRTTGLPQATDDIGNWSEPLGVASLFVEGAVLGLSAGVLWSRVRPARPTARARLREPASASR